jgi:hypothetical protein
MDGHGFHVTLQAIEQVHQFSSNMVTLSSHISHVLQPLDVSCFKPIKIAFKKNRDVTIVRNNYIKLDKVTLVRWIDITLDQSLSKKKLDLDLRL